ncbi:TPA: hypothetical protein ACGSMF_004030 [Bacillus cereus]
MFEKDFTYFGEHAEMTNALLFENGGTDGIFSTAYDVFFTAAIVGFLAGESSREKGDRNLNKTIASNKLIHEGQKTAIIERTIILADEVLDVEGENIRINRALKNFEDEQIKKINRDYIVGYALKGIEILYERLEQSKRDSKDVVFLVNELMEEFMINCDESEELHNFILQLSK